jgi:toxin CcdB
MAQFDIHPLRAGGGLIVDVQSDLIGILNTRMVVPLLPPAQAPKAARRLNPVFAVGGEPVVFVAQFITALPLAELSAASGSLFDQQDAIRAALDMLFLGF